MWLVQEFAGSILGVAGRGNKSADSQ